MFCNLNKIILSFGQIQGFVAEEVGRECTCAHPGEGEPTGGELDDRPRKCPKNALEKIACQNSMDSSRKCHRFASLLGFDVM